ncbi:MAG: DNA repair protein RecO [Patescibacteria group bacterium]|nr:DNA repair protein RecO [Patescibacteria group bacterium]
MSHHLHHTQGILIHSRSYGEANRLLYLLTPDLGLVLVAAQGVRQSYSKLRGQLSNYSQLRLSLVRGRGVWRLTAAESLNGFQVSALPLEARRVWLRLCALLVRLVHGEEGHPELFACFINWAEQLPSLEADALARRSLLWHLELLYLLGYIPKEQLDYARLNEDEPRLVALINQALEGSHL